MTVARAGVSPCTTQDCQPLFISAKCALSVSQMVADNKRLLSVLASASRVSIAARISRVWMVTVAPGATCPARYTVLLWITPCDIRGPVLMRLIVMGGLLGLLVPPAYNGYTIESRSLQALNILVNLTRALGGRHGFGNSRTDGDRLCIESGTGAGVRARTSPGRSFIGHQRT